jgi:hypothetical protein
MKVKPFSGALSMKILQGMDLQNPIFMPQIQNSKDPDKGLPGSKFALEKPLICFQRSHQPTGISDV